MKLDQKTKVQPPHSNTFRILVASDNHIGYKEKHPVRGEDSFKAFNNTLEIAKENLVDFVILGGDLFDEVAPSVESLVKTSKMMTRHIFGSKTIQFELETKEFRPNFANDNLNISIPIFMIHGNHDYPFSNGVSTIDIFKASSYVSVHHE